MDIEDVVQTTQDMKGTFDILFVGEEETRRLVLDGAIYKTDAAILYLYTSDGTIYNYSNVISFKKIY